MNSAPDIDINDEDNPELTAQDVAGMRPGSLVLPKPAGSKFQVYSPVKGEWRWKLSAANGEVLATSSAGYSSRQTALSAIDRVRSAMSAPVVEM
jgi:uncharacterized protein YegP (UPF0339 family)